MPSTPSLPAHADAASAFSRLVDVMAVLRSPEGCPWDREQTFESLSQYVLEEAYEVIDAIERGDLEALKEEVGDHIFEGVFLSQIAADAGAFRVADALNTVADKLVRRHPHVFREDGRVHDVQSKERAPSAGAALSRWDAQKAQDRAQKGQTAGALAGLPKGLPALLRAYKIGKRAAGTGFDWAHAADVVDKMREEVDELRETLALEPLNTDRTEEEMGDLLFAIANLSRKLGVEPEAALRKANDKFTKRFTEMESRITQSGRTMEGMSLDALEEIWQTVKSESKTTHHEGTKGTITEPRNRESAK